MTTKPKIQAGQRMFLAFDEPRKKGQEHEIIVTRVGRKYAYACRADLPEKDRHPYLEIAIRLDDPHGRMWAGCGGRAWPSRDAWIAEVERDRAMAALRRVVDWGCTIPSSVTAADVRRAAELLGVAHGFEKYLEAGR